MKKSLALVCLAVALPAWAAPVSYSKKLVAEVPLAKDALEYRWTSIQQVKEGKARFGAQKRNPSNQRAADESMMTPMMKQLRDRFVKIKTADELDAFLAEIEKNYEGYPQDDVRFFAAHLIPLREMRGFLWRAGPVSGQAKITHSFILTALKSTSASLDMYMPNEQWRAGFDYLTMPYVRDGKICSSFNDEADVVVFLAGPLRQALLKAAQRIQALDLKDKWIVWDNQVLFGRTSFADDLNRYMLVGEVERISSLANLHGALAQITFQRAYSTEKSVQLFKDLGRLYGTDGFLSEIDGAPSSKRVGILRSPAYRSWGTLVEDGQKWMELSFSHLQESVRLAAMVWDQIKREDRSPVDAFFFDTSFARTYERGGDLSIANMLDMIEGPAKIRSTVSGEVVTVDLPGFYRNPPADLKAFLPTEFQRGSEWHKVQLKDGAGKVHEVKYRDYTIGRGTNWNAESYRKMFPALRSGKDVPTHLRVMSQSWGTWLAAIPVAEMVE